MGFVVSKSYKGSKHIRSGKFNVYIKQNDGVSAFFKSDIDDGVYLQSGIGQTLLRINIDFDELEEVDQGILDLINSKK